MNSFTDDDLKRLKEEAQGYMDEQFDDWFVGAGEILALLARLEAAELYASFMPNPPVFWGPTQVKNWEKARDTWRKAAGK